MANSTNYFYIKLVISEVRGGTLLAYCSSCGAELDENANFCPKCGKAIAVTGGRSVRDPLRKSRSKPVSPLTVALIAIAVIVVVLGLIFAVVFLGGWTPLGEVVGSGDLVTREEFFSDFTSVDVGGGFNVEISQSSSYSVLVTADDNVMENILVSKSGDTLNVGVNWAVSLSSVTLKVEITMPELRELELSGGVQGRIEDITSSDSISIDLSGGSHLTGNGEAVDLTVDGSSGSHLDFTDFIVQDASVELSGGSHATINLNGTLDADLSGGSQLHYYGDPTLGDIEKSGGSIIDPAWSA